MYNIYYIIYISLFVNFPSKEKLCPLNTIRPLIPESKDAVYGTCMKCHDLCSVFWEAGVTTRVRYENKGSESKGTCSG